VPQTTYKINTFNAFPGMLADMNQAVDIESAVNADVVSMPAGIMVCYNAPVVPGAVILPIAAFGVANGGIPAGICAHTQAVNTIGLQVQTTTDNVFQVGQPLGLIRKGRVYVMTEIAVLKGDPVYYRYVVNGANNQLGEFSNITDAAKNQFVDGARFEWPSDSPVTNPGNLGVLSFDLNAFMAVAPLTHP
jgi:hypothetical protein